jgi:hypothetical protein
VLLLNASAQGDKARTELREYARLVGKLQLKSTLMGMSVESSLRRQVLDGVLWRLLGRPGWDSTYVREIIALVPADEFDAGALLTSELANMISTVRQEYMVEDAELPAAPKKEADPDAWLAKHLDGVAKFLLQLQAAASDLREKPALLSKPEGLARVAEVVESLGKQKAREDTQMLVRSPAVCFLQQSVSYAALELRLMDLSKPLADRFKDARNLVAKYPALAVKQDGPVAVVEIDQKHQSVTRAKLNTERQVRIEAPAIR